MIENGLRIGRVNKNHPYQKGDIIRYKGLEYVIHSLDSPSSSHPLHIRKRNVNLNEEKWIIPIRVHECQFLLSGDSAEALSSKHNNIGTLLGMLDEERFKGFHPEYIPAEQTHTFNVGDKVVFGGEQAIVVSCDTTRPTIRILEVVSGRQLSIGVNNPALKKII